MVSSLLLTKPPQISLKRGLVSYYPLATGSAVDLQSRFAPQGVLDLTNNNTVDTAVGPSNNLPIAANFNGTTQTLSRVSSGPFNLRDFTITCWFRVSSLGGTRGLLSKWNTTGDQRSFRVLLQTDGSVALNIDTNGTAGTEGGGASAAGVIVVDTWYFAVFSNAFLRINQAAPVVFSPTTPFFGSSDFIIGAGQVGGLFFPGRIAHLGLWNRVLNQSEQSWLYNNGTGRSLVRGV